jgi:diacylglycerol kinase (ATP)
MEMKVILNPKSRTGEQRHLEATLKEKLSPSLKIERTTYPGHGTRIAQEAVKEKIDAVIAVGGDGTVNEVLNGIVGADVPLGIIPTGTANDLASLYQIPGDVAQACDIILDRHLARMDVIRVNDSYYATAGGVGLPCEVVRVVSLMKQQDGLRKRVGRFLGSQIYLFAALCALVRKPRHGHPMKVHWEGHSLTTDALALMVNNQSFVGKRFFMSPGAINTDGLADIWVIENLRSLKEVFSLFVKTLTGSPSDSSLVKTWRTHSLTIQAENPEPFFGDGEIFTHASEFRIKILPKALNIIVPRTGLQRELFSRVNLQRGEEPGEAS